MNYISTFVGNRIRNYRKEKKLSQEKLSELADCHPSYIGQIERGEKNATIESIYKIAMAMNVSLSQLFEKIEEDGTSNIPMRCYDLIASKSLDEQRYLYNLLLDIGKFKDADSVSKK